VIDVGIDPYFALGIATDDIDARSLVLGEAHSA
jgi:hypothetical protein